MPSTIHSNRFSSSVCRVQDEELSSASAESLMLAYVMSRIGPKAQMRLIAAIESDLAEKGFISVDPDETSDCEELIAVLSAVHHAAPVYQLSSLIS